MQTLQDDHKDARVSRVPGTTEAVAIDIEPRDGQRLVFAFGRRGRVTMVIAAVLPPPVVRRGRAGRATATLAAARAGLATCCSPASPGGISSSVGSRPRRASGGRSAVIADMICSVSSTSSAPDSVIGAPARMSTFGGFVTCHT